MPAKRKALPARPANTGTHPMKRTRTKAEEQAVERLREICLALPDVDEKIAWGEPTWRAGKLFAQMDTHHHGAESRRRLARAAARSSRKRLIAEDPETFFRPPYVGHKGWVGVRIDGRRDWKVVASVVRDSHAFVSSSVPAKRRAPKKLATDE